MVDILCGIHSFSLIWANSFNKSNFGSWLLTPFLLKAAEFPVFWSQFINEIKIIYERAENFSVGTGAASKVLP